MTAPTVPNTELAPGDPTASPWTNPSRVYALLSHFLAATVALLGLLHPGWSHPPRFVETWLPLGAVILAGCVALVHLVAAHWLDVTIVKAKADVAKSIHVMAGEVTQLGPMLGSLVPDADAAVRQALGLPPDATVTPEMRSVLTSVTAGASAS